MKKNITFFLFLFTCFFISSCLSSKYFKLGEQLTPLSGQEEIIALVTSKPEGKYQQLGLVRIKGGNLDKRVEEAKLHARKSGGNAVIANEVGVITEPGTDTVIEKIGTSTYETQEFLIVKVEDNEAFALLKKNEEISHNITNAESESTVNDIGKIAPADYIKLPKATYKQLLNDYKSLNGKIFKASLYPKKIYKVPSNLSENATGDRLVLLTTKSGKYEIYLLIDKNNIPLFKTKINSEEMFDFVYTPVQIYKSKAGNRPVIKFIEEITEIH